MLLLFACTSVASQPLLRLTQVAAVTDPTAIVADPRSPSALYVAEQTGRVLRVEGRTSKTVLDLSRQISAGGERGLLGLALHPRWPDDPRLFVNYTHKAEDQLTTRIASFVVRDGAADPASEVEILSFEQPYGNHNSGSLVFGPDGMLYAGIGDGGAANDPKATGQRLDDFLGSVVRLDVNTPPYAVPPDNPFVGRAGARPEVWAYGLRNPWGMAFDGADLWLADVGQNAWEEVNLVTRGGNYGWNRMEAGTCFQADACDRAGLLLPVASYPHSVGNSITGGVVYRGPSVPIIDGKYVYGDYAQGRLFATTRAGVVTDLGTYDVRPSAFGTDRDGRLYLGDYRGKLWRVEP